MGGKDCQNAMSEELKKKQVFRLFILGTNGKTRPG